MDGIPAVHYSVSLGRAVTPEEAQVLREERNMVVRANDGPTRVWFGYDVQMDDPTKNAVVGGRSCVVLSAPRPLLHDETFAADILVHRGTDSAGHMTLTGVDILRITSDPEGA